MASENEEPTGFVCPSRTERGAAMMGEALPKSDSWQNEHCSYCGGANGDMALARIEAGDVTLTPTDKGYKIYMHNYGGAPFIQTYRNCYETDADGVLRTGPGNPIRYKEPRCTGPDDCTHWMTRPIEQTKFYFWHWTTEQQHRFVVLLNTGRLRLDYPGYFYRLPYFFERPNG